MPYPLFEKKCHSINWLLSLVVLFISMGAKAQIKWDGEAGDGQWSTAANWVGNILPAPADNVLLDNGFVTGNYTVSLPSGMSAITVKSILISPATGNTIQFILPSSNTATPAFTAIGPGHGITINNGGLLVNSSGATGAAAIVVADSFRINNGGQYTHNTRSAHAALVKVLSGIAGTETGIFKFDVPGGTYTFSATSRNYGTLIFSSATSGGIQGYTASAASPFTVNGDLIIKTGVTVNLDITAATIIKGNFMQEGGVFNLASQANNNVVYLKGNLMQTAGTITETSTGLPSLELNGNLPQNVQVSGGILNSINLRINNSAGIHLLSNLSLPYNLSLLNGIVNTHSFLITLLNGCNIVADSLSGSFINGPLRKEGLSVASHFLFPVGKDIAQRWLELKDASGNYTVEFFKANPAGISSVIGPDLHHISSIEYWTIKADAIPAPAAKIELSFDNVNSSSVTDMATLRVAHLENNTWTDEGNTATTGNAGSAGSVVSNSVTMFTATDYFSLSSNNPFQNPLPLKLQSFNAKLQQNKIELSWIINNGWLPAAFELQASSDGIYFNLLAKMDAGFNQSIYTFTDTRKLSGHQYYRLKMIERDGTIWFSQNIAVAINTIETGIQLWPSIVKSAAVLFIDAGVARTVQINIYSMDGVLVKTTAQILHAGRNNIPLQLEQLPAGVYTLKVTGADNKIDKCRFIKQ